ncbi:MAG: hypothetical protein MHM6MM_009402 [Cercozoa sp. M6MM]
MSCTHTHTHTQQESRQRAVEATRLLQEVDTRKPSICQSRRHRTQSRARNVQYESPHEEPWHEFRETAPCYCSVDMHNMSQRDRVIHAVYYIRRLFESLFARRTSTGRPRRLFVHVTSAVDGSSAVRIFDSILESIRAQNLTLSDLT